MFLDILYFITIRPLEILFETVFFTVYNRVGKPFTTLFALSLIVNILVFPLYRRADKLQSEQREREKAMESRISHIKKTFKGDEKVMMLQAYYRISDYKPVYALRGVSSLLLQIPFFIAAFRFLSGVTVLKGMPSILLSFIHNPYGPVYLINDLGAPDGAIHLLGHNINFLPILMTVINIVSGTIYSKGHLRKEKIQLYVTALVFLVLLYNSPAGLVIYWTFNNLFSLLKNAVQKFVEMLKAKKAAETRNTVSESAESGVSLKKESEKKYNPIFLSGAFFLALISGFYIPSNVISASPIEFVSNINMFDPARYLVYSLALGIGFFVVWIGIYFIFSSVKVRKYIAYAMIVLSAVAVIDYMMSGSGLGSISSELKYDEDPVFAVSSILLNLGLIAAVTVLLSLILKFKPAICSTLALAGCVALIGVSCSNVFAINKEYNEFYERYSESDVYSRMPQITLSKTGKNVVIIMLDRAMGPAIPYILNERPDLMEEFDGFTFYHDTISFGGYTNFAMPSVFGGYEYTPYNMNARSDELLVDTTNEALKVLPTLFTENGYGVTVMDPPLAGYKEIPDLSIFDDIPGINTYYSRDKFFDGSSESEQVAVDDLKRNFYYFGQMKIFPLCLQGFLYDSGDYNSGRGIANPVFDNTDEHGYAYSRQFNDGIKIANGLNQDFMQWYSVLDNLSGMTVVDENETGEFLMMYNSTTHEPALLQLPEYEPQVHVDNTAFDYEAYNTINGVTMRMEDEFQVEHYQVNMAAMLKMAEWFDYLREEGVYDNTRIIIVADHGRGIGWFHAFSFGEKHQSCEWYLPLFMVKDFDSHGFEMSTEFMTNADTCIMALDGVIDDPVNPFTGNPLDGHEKYEDEIRIIGSDWFDFNANNGTRFFDSDWYTVSGNPYDNTNWEYIGHE
ncbi:MAG: YidC/Oxa1 family membrane protein insertase [Lachnospiraceae bacterium]|nr:YidC/Oxa1 family membrane protein insertase [Lachnospiraceae bacterium]